MNDVRTDAQCSAVVLLLKIVDGISLEELLPFTLMFILSDAISVDFLGISPIFSSHIPGIFSFQKMPFFAVEVTCLKGRVIGRVSEFGPQEIQCCQL